MHLLVLDDDEQIARFLANVAKGEGWSVDITTSAGDFQACYRQRRPDAIVLDLKLGDSDGIEQLGFLGKDNYSGDVVLMSGFDARVLDSAQQVGDALGVRVVGVVEKPARVARVRELLRSIANDGGAAVADAPSARASSSQPIEPAAIIAAIDRAEFDLYLQPIVSSLDGSVSRAEALIRWRHPTNGLLSPDQFIPVAEQDVETIDRLTAWVIEEALHHRQRLQRQGMTIQIAVNVSGNNLRALDFPDRVETALKAFGAPPDALALEVTETIATQGSHTTMNVLTRLRLKGVALAIDDFGVGGSTLEALRQLPFSTIKIDKIFVRDMARSRDAMAIVQSIVQLARNMSLATVAEGVESDDIAQLLTGLGCDGLQGYLYSPPLPIDEFAAWLSAQRASSRAMEPALTR
jgi:EAL domain-containing protein (putative c-di-GMP-specific phosphodiesterase class I)/FixJ family two-component response regulator